MSRETWSYESDEYEIIGETGRGANGSANLLKRGTQFYVLKSLKNPNDHEAYSLENYRSGTSIHVYSSSNGRVCDNDFILMDYIPGVSLHEFLKIYKDRNIDIPRLNKYIIIYGIAKAIYNLHSIYNVRHRDIKPQNIFIDQDFRPHLGDFGDITECTKTFHEHGTLEFIPPETVKDIDCYDWRQCRNPFDVWSFGATLFQILTFEWPFSHIPLESRREYIIANKKDNRVDIGELKIRKHDRELYELVKFCWKKDPKKRPEMSDIIWIINEDAKRRLDEEELQKFNEYKDNIETTNPIICGTEKNVKRAIELGFTASNEALERYRVSENLEAFEPNFPAIKRETVAMRF